MSNLMSGVGLKLCIFTNSRNRPTINLRLRTTPYVIMSERCSAADRLCFSTG